MRCRAVQSSWLERTDANLGRGAKFAGNCSTGSLWWFRVRSLPIGLLLIAWLRQLPKGVWWWRILLLGSLDIGLFQALLFVAAYRFPGGVAATAGSIQPLLVVWFSWIILHEKPSKRSIVAAIAGLVGVGLLVLGPAAQLLCGRLYRLEEIR